MTITNHIKWIQNEAEAIIEHADARDYASAHVNLDNIESHVRGVRNHIKELQRKADCAARPAGDEPS